MRVTNLLASAANLYFSMCNRSKAAYKKRVRYGYTPPSSLKRPPTPLVSESQQEQWDDAKNLEIFKYNVESLAPLKKFKLQGTTQDKDKNNYIRFLYPL